MAQQGFWVLLEAVGIFLVLIFAAIRSSLSLEIWSSPLGSPSVILFLTAAGLAQSVESFTAERDVEGSIPGTGPTFMVLK